MQRIPRSRLFAAAMIVGASLFLGWLGIAARSSPGGAQTKIAPAPWNPLILPADAQPTCTVPPAMFASWFDTGMVIVDGVVKPADSVNFPNAPNCSFYQWSEQMFLWATSPAPAAYGGG